MGLLSMLFGTKSPQKVMLQLLSGPSTEMTNEMGRVYINQIKILSEDYDNVKLSARGILKARLFGSCFMLYVYGTKWNDDSLTEIMNLSSGLAMLCFSSDKSLASIDVSDAKSITGSYMLDVIKAIKEEVKEGSSSGGHFTKGFEKLIALYISAIMESVDDESIEEQICEQLEINVVGIIFANLKNTMLWQNGI
jgi:hypothetical protein